MDELQGPEEHSHTAHANTTSAGDTQGLGTVTRRAPYVVPLTLNTHNVITNAHIHNVQQFSKDLSNAVAAVWTTRHENRYSGVQVLILSWEDDDLGVYREIEALHETFRDLYNYQVTEWLIPKLKPERKLSLQIGEFLDEHDSKDKLLIIYYAGHGFLNDQRVPMWAARQDPSSPSLPSGSIQSQLEEADADVLLLLDCCHAAHPTLTDSKHGVTEAIAACGFETTAPGVGPHSFTNALIQELEIASQGPPIPVAKLHGRILWRLKTWKPSLQRDRNGHLQRDENGTIPVEQEKRVTAVHCFLTNEVVNRSIMLAPLKPNPNLTLPASSSQSESSPSNPKSASSYISDESGSSSSKTTTSNISQSDKAQVIISVSIDSDDVENNMKENVEIWTEILRLLPPTATGIKIESFYGSFSKLVLISMPISVWNMLADNPAYAFVGFVSTKNMEQEIQTEILKAEYHQRTGSNPPTYDLQTAYNGILIPPPISSTFYEDTVFLCRIILDIFENLPHNMVKLCEATVRHRYIILRHVLQSAFAAAVLRDILLVLVDLVSIVDDVVPRSMWKPLATCICSLIIGASVMVMTRSYIALHRARVVQAKATSRDHVANSMAEPPVSNALSLYVAG